jgi:uncharacterized protein
MENRLPSRFNPVEFARNSEAVQLVLPVSHFKRFSALLSDDSGEVSAQAKFYIGADKTPVAEGSLNTSVTVICQRCMRPMTIDISCNYSLAFVSSEERADDLPDEVDPVLMDENNEVSNVDFLEDELILQLPMSTLHEDESLCDTSVAVAVTENRQSESAKTHRPFSDLGKLLKH